MNSSLKGLFEDDNYGSTKSVANQFKSKKSKAKKKRVGAYMDIANWELFTQINNELGEYNNAVLNKLVENYVNRNKNKL